MTCLYFLNNPARRWQMRNMEPNLISCFKKSSKSGLVSSDTKCGLIHKKSCEPLPVSLWFVVIGSHYWASIWIIFIFQGFRLSSRFVLSALDFNEADKQVVRRNLVAILRRELPCKNQNEFAQKKRNRAKIKSLDNQGYYKMKFQPKGHKHDIQQTNTN